MTRQAVVIFDHAFEHLEVRMESIPSEPVTVTLDTIFGVDYIRASDNPKLRLTENVVLGTGFTIIMER